ncbi:hypothetical protein CCACVL1_25681, partial [Corchorus capsularis]
INYEIATMSALNTQAKFNL